MENLKYIFQLYFRPASAMSGLLDTGSWMIAAVLMIVVAAGFYYTVNQRLADSFKVPVYGDFVQAEYRAAIFGDDDVDVDSEIGRVITERARQKYNEAVAKHERVPVLGDAFFKIASVEPRNFFQPFVTISVLYIPALVLLVSLLGGAGSFGVLIRRDYGALSTCALSAWTAAHLPFAIAGVLLSDAGLPALAWFAMWAASALLFGVLMIFAVRVVLGAGWGAAVVAVGIGAAVFPIGIYVYMFVSPWLFSPFLLLVLLMYFGGAVTGGNNAFRQRQNFKRFLHNATVNPRDADAHVQLGLIYLQRRQEEKAAQHFRQAFEIDPEEVDANYELGRLARKRGELQTALDHFSTVVGIDEKYALSEIWREIGATYMEAGMSEPARDALEKFVERRPVDPEGLYYLGKICKEAGDSERARELFTEAVTAVKTSPGYRRGELRQWQKLAEKEL